MSYKLDAQNEVAAVIARLSGRPASKIAETLDCHPDTIRRAVKRNPERMAMFTPPTDKDGWYSLSNAAARTLIIAGTFVCSKLWVTGDINDGVLIAHELYESEAAGDDQEEIEDWYFDDTDVGIIKPVKVGKIILRNALVTDRAASQPDVIVDHKAPFPANGSDIGYILNAPPVPTIKPKVAIGQVSQVIVDQAKLFIDSAHKITTQLEVKKPEPVWNASKRFVSITIGREVYNATNCHPSFQDILIALAAEDYEKAVELINVERAVKRYVKGNVTITDGQLMYKDIEIKTGLTTRIINAMNAGQDFEFFLPFLENLMLNPSRKAVTRLFDFLTANDIEITADGHFLAWKKVNHDFTDIRTSKMDNSPGKVVKMERNQVDEDDETTCSSGLHVCAKSYLGHYATGGHTKVVQVKVHPKDVVSIPVDYKNAKMRTCEYLVVKSI